MIKSYFFTISLFLFLNTMLFAQNGFELVNTFDLGLPASGLNDDRVGQSISVLGDINGDGFDDWAVSIGGADYESGENHGAVHIYFGSAIRRESETQADLIIQSTNEIRVGLGAWRAGDVNNDGIDDILIYTLVFDSNIGENISEHALYYGGNPFDTDPDVLFRKPVEHEGYANYSSSAGDVNNDGYDDILLSNPTALYGTDTAHVYLYYGAENMDNIPDEIFTGKMNPPGLGGGAEQFNGAATAGDVNNDGFDDFLISSDDGAQLFFGGTNISTTYDVLLNIATRPIVSTAGDVNNDGYADMLFASTLGLAKAFICYGGSFINTDPVVTIPTWTNISIADFSIATAGDLNQDGFDDFMLGTNTNSSIENAEVRIYYGSAVMDSIADISIYTSQLWNVFGYSVAGGGDFDGDTFPDLLIGDIGNAATINKHDDAGNISIFYGGVSFSDTADAVFSGIADQESFGSSVASAGDVNNDGFEDLIVGASSHWEGPYHYAGRAYLYYGGETYSNTPDLIFNTTFIYNGNHANFGKNVGSAGDINGDGFSDIYIEEYFKVSIFLGGAAMENVADYELIMNVSNYSFSALGDVNNDGYDDILYGKPSDGSGGRAYLLLGGENLLDNYDAIFEGESVDDNLGAKTTNAGDLNNDGFTDFLIAVPGDDSNGSNTGAVQVFFGKDTISNIPDLVLYGTQADPFPFNFASHLGSGGDINNDGFDDIVISNGLFSLTSSSNEGRIYIFYGGTSINATPDVVLTGKSEKMYLGLRTIKLIPDLNDDGFEELLTSEGNYQSGGDDREKPVIFYGGAPIDSVLDITLPYSSVGSDLEYYLDEEDNSVKLLVGDPSNSAAGPQMGRVICYSNGVVSSIETHENELAPKQIQLHQNYPNPFNPSTTISFTLPESSIVKISVFNSLGEKVAGLLNHQMAEGYHSVDFDGKNLSSGIYFYRIVTDKYSSTKKMMLLK